MVEIYKDIWHGNKNHWHLGGPNHYEQPSGQNKIFHKILDKLDKLSEIYIEVENLYQKRRATARKTTDDSLVLFLNLYKHYNKWRVKIIPHDKDFFKTKFKKILEEIENGKSNFGK